ncbi:RNase adapter RapZ [Corynebacterium kroppenstedtii]
MSGGGRQSTANVLEEMGWYVADNLPPELIMRMVELSFSPDSPIERLAIVTDVRSRAFAGSLGDVLSSLEEDGRRPIVMFLDADDETLIKRFDTVRRKHPLQGTGTLQMGISRERGVLEDIRDQADIVIDTTNFSIHDLRRDIERCFDALDSNVQHITLQSFGFKHGIPKDADLVIDVRFLPNPYWVPHLREFRGTDHEVADYVLSHDNVDRFISSFLDMFSVMQEGYKNEGKNFTTVAIGCTGGHHRSVAVTEEIARRLRTQGDEVTVTHRDFDRD